jgi:carboxypeptidase T
MARDFHYHFYDRDGQVAVPKNGRHAHGIETLTVYSLKKDMDKLRQDGAAKGIVDASVVDVGTSSQGRKLFALKVGKGTQHRVLFTGCHHAREWISVELAYLVAEFLIQNYNAGATTERDKRIRYIVDNRTIWFVPMVNPDGHEYTTRVNRWWRGTRKTHTLPAQTIFAPLFRGGGAGRTVTIRAGDYDGVDPNRNYATSDWGEETFTSRGDIMTSRDPTDGGLKGIWCGPSAESEVETKAIADLITHEPFRSALSYHNDGQFVLFPDASARDTFTQFVGRGMSTLINAKGNPYTYESGSALYATTGDGMDYVYEKKPPRPAITVELRPPDGVPDELRFAGLPDTQIGPCFRENLGAALALINCAGFDQPAGAIQRGTAPGSARQVSMPVVPNCWKVFEGF